MTSTQAASGPALQQPLDPQVQALTLLWAMGVQAQGPSIMHALLGACDLWSLPVVFSECFGFKLDTPHTPEGALGY